MLASPTNVLQVRALSLAQICDVNYCPSKVRGQGKWYHLAVQFKRFAIFYFRWKFHPECCAHPIRKWRAKTAFNAWRNGKRRQKHAFCKIYKDQMNHCKLIVPEFTVFLDNIKNQKKNFAKFVENKCMT